MAQRITRRDMLRSTAVVGAGITIVGPAALARGAETSPNEKLNVVCIGVGGRGSANVGGVKGENIIAFCDVDDERAAKTYENFPQVTRKFRDYRKMFDELGKDIDAVVVSTPDHTHYDPSMTAMRMGKHLYCEKPMAHSPLECRNMIEMAREADVVTQLGVQRHTLTNMHRVVEVLQSGGIGDVTEVYTWVGGSRGMPSLPTEFPAVPANLDWKLWVGPAKMRDYSPSYCPYNWRFWWDFGTGEAGNWGCHLLDIPFWALGLKYPTAVLDVSGPEADPQRTSKSMSVTFQFPARGEAPPVKLHWSHTTQPPAPLAEFKVKCPGSGSLFIGEKGMLLTDFDKHILLPESDFADYERPEPFIPNSPGFYKEWIAACKGAETSPTCDFDYSGPLAETVILGNVAYRVGKPFEWDAENLVAVDTPEADRYIRPELYNGYEY